MAKLPIVIYPNPVLAVKCDPVTVFDDKLAQLAADMAETMYAAPGVGLAAPQVGHPIRLITIDVSEEKDQLLTLVNPVITSKSEEEVEYEEGCLSLPGIWDKVVRPSEVTVRAQDLKGNFFERHCEGLLAVCVQHEIDHLDGIVFIDHLSRLKKERDQKKLHKLKLAAKKKAEEDAARS
ncbi:peptide deformylase [Mesosutterella multiformis]|uniref:Peptide deformylase n=1 Tax=Mesosutterella multiformis TaxID=2259133 RepID=A0A388SCE3_9BURK|nr:peptide deformylase [Mesosutterella multiformis]MBS5811535.1 peptide deformylase [Sutterella sp.]MCH3935774.1 peptide deformylase [Mesosutterella sp.]RGU80954.1 peptide deformylase [Sutterella sp. AF15-45LB]RGU81554.1 peptide deformylase [Sutterella sp. AF15-44LB]RHH06672.1 peptide deformylase [Sutterella sp. AM18-8-1]